MNFYFLNLEILNQELSGYSSTSIYSNIIFKNQSFKDRVKSSLNPHFNFIEKESINFESEEDLVIWTSNVVFLDSIKMKLFLEKLWHAEGSFRWGNEEGFIFKGTKKDFDNKNYKNFKLENTFLEITDFQSFQNLLEVSLDTRAFNKIEKSADTYIKKSKDIKKIEMEFNFLSSLPEDLKTFFIKVHSFKISGQLAEYSMPRINYLDISRRHINGEISKNETEILFEQLSIYFENVMEYGLNRNDEPFNFISEKTNNRIVAFKSLEIYSPVNEVFKFSPNFKSIDEAFKTLNFFLEKNKKNINKKGSIISHGDLCFSNILASKNFKDLIFIDPMGGSIDSSMRSIYYDFAKLSHSILGGYDLIIHNLSELAFNEDMHLHVSFKKERNKYLEDGLFGLLDKFNLSKNITRLIEASLFLSMLPLHSENQKRTSMLAVRGSEILAELTKNKTI
tara:strand:+ start:3236 stop:4585 length:1350 start_codon:yes stop_codon:yes gene_type:complete